jgi:uncharacterized protein YceK
MIRATRIMWLTLAIGVLPGCGTMANVVWLAPYEGGMQPYGGVQADLTVAKEAVDHLANRSKDSSSLDMGWVALLDLPLSGIADTITLPLTVPYTLLHPDPWAVLRSARTQQDSSAGVRTP